MDGSANAHARLNVRFVGDESGFSQLAPAWNKLAVQSRHPIFSSHEWFSAAWAWRRTDADLNILCVYSGDELIGVLPLVRLRAPPSGQRFLEFLCVPDAQFCDLLVHHDNAVVVSEWLASHLLARASVWDVLRLERLPADSFAATALLPALRSKIRNCSLNESEHNLFVPLEGAWEDYWGARSRSFKKALNLARNRVGRSGPFEVERVTASSTAARELSQRLEEVVKISCRSWKQQTGITLGAGGPRAFIERLTEFAYRSSALSIWILRIQGRPVAMEYQLMDRDSVYALRSDFDEEYEHLSPGSFLSKFLMQTLFAADVRRYYMGPGRNPYKTHWSETGEALYCLVAYSRTLRGRASAFWYNDVKPKLRPLKERLMPFLRRYQTKLVVSTTTVVYKILLHVSPWAGIGLSV